MESNFSSPLNLGSLLMCQVTEWLLFFLKKPFWDMSEHTVLFFFFNFIYLWLCWVFVSVWGLSLVVESKGHSSSQCTVLSQLQPLLLRSTGSRHAGSVTVAHGPRCSAACGILPDQGSNLCPLHWQADSQPLRHQGSPEWLLLFLFPLSFFKLLFCLFFKLLFFIL